MPIGIVPTSTYQPRRESSVCRISGLRSPRTQATRMRAISVRKYRRMAAIVPSWMTAVNAAPGSSQPANAGTMRRCAVLETGRNSVRPCTKPSTIACAVSTRAAYGQVTPAGCGRSGHGLHDLPADLARDLDERLGRARTVAIAMPEDRDSPRHVLALERHDLDVGVEARLGRELWHERVPDARSDHARSRMAEHDTPCGGSTTSRPSSSCNVTLARPRYGLSGGASST